MSGALQSPRRTAPAKHSSTAGGDKYSVTDSVFSQRLWIIFTLIISMNVRCTGRSDPSRVRSLVAKCKNLILNKKMLMKVSMNICFRSEHKRVRAHRRSMMWFFCWRNEIIKQWQVLDVMWTLQALLTEEALSKTIFNFRITDNRTKHIYITMTCLYTNRLFGTSSGDEPRLSRH